LVAKLEFYTHRGLTKNARLAACFRRQFGRNRPIANSGLGSAGKPGNIPNRLARMMQPARQIFAISPSVNQYLYSSEAMRIMPRP
jgi:hypothetical protein